MSWKVLDFVLGAAGVGITLWCIFTPTPYIPCVIACCLLPWAGLLAIYLSNGRISVDGQKSDKRADGSILFFLPALAVGARALIDYSLLDWLAALYCAIVISVAWNIAILLARRGERSRGFIATTVILLIFGVDYGYGLVTFADVLADSSVAATYKPTIVGKHVTHGRSDTYYLELSPWADGRRSDERVGRDLYDATSVSGQVCIDVHRGRLGLKWYEVHGCR